MSKPGSTAFFSGKAWLILPFLLALLAIGLFFLPSHRPLPPELPEVSRNALVLRENRLYLSNSAVPFTGFMIEDYEEGVRKSHTTVSNGLLNGLSEGWHTNGQLQVREYFTNGISHGVREKWHDNGIKMSEATIVAGQIEGTFQRWHDNGQLAETIEMKNGEADGVARSFYPSGFLKAEARLKRGNLITNQTWSDETKKFLPPKIE